MSSPEAEPVKRRPGRPRKNPAPEIVAESDPAAKALDEPKPLVDVAPEPVIEEKSHPSDPNDERIGQLVDPAWKSISYSTDDRQYRIEDGVIVERMR